MMKKCTQCDVILLDRHKIKFCSNRCQWDYQYYVFIESWRSGTKSGSVGISAITMSNHIRRYLVKKNGNSCSMCGWDKVHPITSKVPLEIDHIDGNSENNSEHNLRLLCPNCHSLTPYFRNLNRGRGRKWRMDKYNRNRVAL